VCHCSSQSPVNVHKVQTHIQTEQLDVYDTCNIIFTFVTSSSGVPNALGLIDICEKIKSRDFTKLCSFTSVELLAVETGDTEDGVTNITASVDCVIKIQK